MVVVLLPETAGRAAQTLAVDLNVRAHLAQRLGEPKAILVHGLVDDGQALGLREGHDEGLLPVGHESGVDGRLQRDRVQRLARVVETDAVSVDIEAAADLAESIEERGHVGLVSAAHVDVAAGGQGGRGPRSGLDAVGQRRVAVARQLGDALDADRAVCVHGDDRAHLLQDVDQVEDLGLDGCALQGRDALVAHGREQRLFSGTHGREGQLNDRAVQAREGTLNVHAVGLLVNDRAELAKRLQVEVDGTPADRAAAQLGDEGLAELVQERAAEQDRDARGARERVDVRARGDLDVGGIHAQRAAILIKVDLDAVQAQQVRDDVGVADQRHVVQLGGCVGQQRRDHGLGNEVLGTANGDLAAQRMAAFNLQDGWHGVLLTMT